MSLWKIAWRSIQQRALASALTALSMALGVALVVSVLVMYGVISRSFTQGAQGYDMIVGAKGSKLQLVLNTVFHLSTPVENVPWSYYKEFLPKGRFGQQVQIAIPYCLGDNYEDHRVVGTTPQMFEIEYAQGHAYAFSAGRNFEDDHFFEAVVGALAARETGLRVGSTFQPTHGVSGEDGHKHDAFTVVGLLAPTGTPNDRALFVNMEGFFLLEGHAKEEGGHQPKAAGGKTEVSHEHDDHAADKDHDHEHAKVGATAKDAHDEKHEADHDHAKEPAKGAPAAAKHDHDEKPGTDHDHEKGPAADHDHEHGHAHDHAHEHHEPLPESQREVTAILVRTTNPLWNMSLAKSINKGVEAQAVFPATEIYNLFQGLVSNLEWILLVLAALIVVVAGIGIMVSIYNSMSDRRREIAVMRSLGAGRTTVLTIVLLESILLSLGGGVFGFVLGHSLIGALSPMIVAHTGVSIGWFEFDLWEFVLIPALVALASLVGYLPAMTAYRTDVAKALTASP